MMDGLMNSRPPRTLPTFSQAMLGAQHREGTGLRGPRKDLSLKVLLTEGPALPGYSNSHSADCWGIPSPYP